MHKTSYSLSCSQKKLRLLSDQHFISIPMKVKKADVSSVLVNGILEAGTLIAKDAKAVTTTAASEGNAASTNAAGIVYQDIDFKNLVRVTGSEGDECAIVPVLVHGTVYESEVKLDKTNGAVEKAAMPMIYFGA